MTGGHRFRGSAVLGIVLLSAIAAIVAYNVGGQPRNDGIIVDASFHKAGDTLRYLYGSSGGVPVERAPDGSIFARVPLQSHQFVVLE